MSAPMPDFESADARPRWRIPRRRVWIATVAGAALVAGALAIGIPGVQRDPAEQLAQLVDDYVAAVEAGDAEAAAALHDADDADASASLLGVATPSVPAALECVAPEVDGDVARVACDVVVTPPNVHGTQTGTGTIELVRDGDWAIASGLERRASLFLAAGEVTAIGGARVPGGVGVTRGPMLLPGVYDVTVAASPMLEPRLDEGLVVGPRGSALWVTFEPAQEVLVDAHAFVLEHVRACIAAGDDRRDCAVPRFADDARLEATTSTDIHGAGSQGTTHLPIVLVGEAGAPPQVEVVVRVRYATDFSSYELAIEQVSAVAP